jgi:hypothetical protein
MMVRCDNCGGMGRITTAVNAGHIGQGYFRSDICDECDGEGEIEMTCLTCEAPLDKFGWCLSCDDSGLTEPVQGDPFGKRFAA